MVLISNGETRKDRHSREGHLRMEGEIAVMQPQAKKCPEPPEAGRGKERFSPRVFGGNMALLILEFCL